MKLSACLLSLLLATAEAGAGPGPASSGKERFAMTFELTSPAFAPGQPIPRKYTCDGEDVSPPLQWSAPPAGSQSLALVVDDPDAPSGTWVHWLVYNLPASRSALPESVPPAAHLPDQGKQGRNSWQNLGYGGPCPPGGTHRYFFRLYALDAALALPAGASSEQLRKAMQGHVLGQAETMGTYKR